MKKTDWAKKWVYMFLADKEVVTYSEDEEGWKKYSGIYPKFKVVMSLRRAERAAKKRKAGRR